MALYKTYKLYINGAFPRSEQGRVLTQLDAQGKPVANYCWATRKDCRDAIQAARAAQPAWVARGAFNRSQILYRLAEMLADRASLFSAKLQTVLGWAPELAAAEAQAAVNLTFSYAGWADKYAQVLGSVNPVAGSFTNFTYPEPTGVVAVFCSQQSPLVGLVAAILPIVLSGNTVCALVDAPAPLIAVDFAEALATSDFPPGVVNILTGQFAELLKPVASHADLNALAYFGNDRAVQAALQIAASETVTRCHCQPDPAAHIWQGAVSSPAAILPFLEFKTVWQPNGF